MEHTLLYNCFLNKFFKHYDCSQETNDKIEKSISEIQDLLPEDEREKVSSLKYAIINHWQDLGLEHMKQAMDFGILIGIEIQENISKYIDETS